MTAAWPTNLRFPRLHLSQFITEGIALGPSACDVTVNAFLVQP